MSMSPLLAIFGLGPTELLVFLVVVLLLFGSRLPSLMRNMGRSVVEFKKGVNDVGEEIDGDQVHQGKPS